MSVYHYFLRKGTVGLLKVFDKVLEAEYSFISFHSQKQVKNGFIQMEESQRAEQNSD